VSSCGEKKTFIAFRHLSFSRGGLISSFLRLKETVFNSSEIGVTCMRRIALAKTEPAAKKKFCEEFVLVW